jgi:cyanate permease
MQCVEYIVNYHQFESLDKHQITSTKTQTRTKQQIPKHKHAEGQYRFSISFMNALPACRSLQILAPAVWSLAFWYLVLVCYLVLVVWCFSLRTCFGFAKRQNAHQF